MSSPSTSVQTLFAKNIFCCTLCQAGFKLVNKMNCFHVAYNLLPFSSLLTSRRMVICSVIFLILYLSTNTPLICGSNVHYSPQHYYQFPSSAIPSNAPTVRADSAPEKPRPRLLSSPRTRSRSRTGARASLSQPQNLHASVIDHHTVRLMWDAPREASKRQYTYSIYYQPKVQRAGNSAESDDAVQVVNLTASQASLQVVIGNLRYSTPYSFKIIAYDAGGRAGDSSDELRLSTANSLESSSGAAADDPNRYRPYTDLQQQQKLNAEPFLSPNMPPPPLAPRRLQALPLGTSVIKLRWQSPVSTNNRKPNSYTVQYRMIDDKQVQSVSLNAAELEAVASNSMFAGQAVESAADSSTTADEDDPNNPLPIGHELTGLQPRSMYDIRVAAIFDDGQTFYTPWVRATTLTNELNEKRVPGMPQRLEATKITSNSITIRWQPPDDAAEGVRVRGYFIGWGRGVPDVYTTTVEYGTTSYTITSNIEPFASYIVSVRAFNNEGEGRQIEDHIITKPFSTTTSSTLAPRPPPPPPPTAAVPNNVPSTQTTPLSPPIAVQALVQSANTMLIRWTDTSLNNNDDQRLYTVRLTNSDSISGDASVRLYNTTQQHYKVENLAADTLYDVAVKSSDVKLNGQAFLPRESTWSATVSNRTLTTRQTVPPQAQPPRWPQLSTSLPVSAPSDLTVNRPPTNDADTLGTLAATSAFITFSTPRKLSTSAKISSYALYYTTSASADAPVGQWAQQTIDGRATSYYMKNLKPLTTYHFRLQAHDDEKGLGGPLSPVVTYTTPSLLLAGKIAVGSAPDAYKRSGAAATSYVADEQSRSATAADSTSLIMKNGVDADRSLSDAHFGSDANIANLPVQLVVIAAGVCFIIILVVLLAAFMIRNKMTSKAPQSTQQQYALGTTNQRRSMGAAAVSIPITLGTSSAHGVSTSLLPVCAETVDDEESSLTRGGDAGPWTRQRQSQSKQQHVIELRSFAAPNNTSVTDGGVDTTMLSYGNDSVGGSGIVLIGGRNTLNRGGNFHAASPGDFGTGEFDTDTATNNNDDGMSTNDRACLVVDQHGNVIATTTFNNNGSIGGRPGSISQSVSPHQQQLTSSANLQFESMMYPAMSSSANTTTTTLLTSPKMFLHNAQASASSSNPNSVRSSIQPGGAAATLMMTAAAAAAQQQAQQLKYQQQQAAAARFFATATQTRRNVQQQQNGLLYGRASSISPPPTMGNMSNVVQLHGPDVIYGTSSYATGNRNMAFLLNQQQQQYEQEAEPMLFTASAQQPQPYYFLQQRQVLPQHDRIEITHGTLRRGAANRLLGGSALPQNSFFSQQQPEQQQSTKSTLQQQCNSPAVARLQLRSTAISQQQQPTSHVSDARRGSDCSTIPGAANDATPVQRRSQNNNAPGGGPVINFRTIAPSTGSISSGGGAANGGVAQNSNSISPSNVYPPSASTNNNSLLLIQHQRISSFQQQQQQAESGFGSGTSASTLAPGSDTAYSSTYAANSNPLNSFSSVPPPPATAAASSISNRSNLSTSSSNSTPQPTPNSTTALIASSANKSGNQLHFTAAGGHTSSAAASDNQSDRLSMNSSSNYSISNRSGGGGGGAANGGTATNAGAMYQQQQQYNNPARSTAFPAIRPSAQQQSASTITNRRVLPPNQQHLFDPTNQILGASPLVTHNRNNSSSNQMHANNRQQVYYTGRGGGGGAGGLNTAGGAPSEPMLPSLYPSTEELYEDNELDGIMKNLNEAIAVNDMLLNKSKNTSSSASDNTNSAAIIRSFNNNARENGEKTNSHAFLSSRVPHQQQQQRANDNNNFLC